MHTNNSFLIDGVEIPLEFSKYVKGMGEFLTENSQILQELYYDFLYFLHYWNGETLSFEDFAVEMLLGMREDEE